MVWSSFVLQTWYQHRMSNKQYQRLKEKLNTESNANDTRTRNPYQKTGTSFSCQMKLEAKFLDQFFYTAGPIHFKAIKQQTTQLV